MTYNITDFFGNLKAEVLTISDYNFLIKKLQESIIEAEKRYIKKSELKEIKQIQEELKELTKEIINLKEKKNKKIVKDIENEK